jgi:hemoglobin/transferrin/lactoferrin receptor protein
MRLFLFSSLILLSTAISALAATVSGRVADKSGGVLPGATVELMNIATGESQTATTGPEGRYAFANLRVGLYRVAATLAGFSDASRSVVLQTDSQSAAIDFALEIGSVRAEVTVAADRGARDTQVVPLRVDTISADAIRELTVVSTGDAMLAAPGVTAVGSGPFQVRPRLRGLDSTRVLVLVDGERLNNARTATDRAGVEVGLVDPDSIESIEVLGGAGSVLYGTDALSGTVNIITNQPRFSPKMLMTAGFDGFYSSNENGRRGTVTLGISAPRLALSFTGGGEHYDDYNAGKHFGESSVPLFTNGTLKQVDTIDTNFPGFNLKAFPEPFNAPFTRATKLIPNSGMDGTSLNVAGKAQLAPGQTLDIRFQRRRTTDVGFPDFAAPSFFQQITLPTSGMDKSSGTYTATNITPWLSKLAATVYYQHQDRLLRNQVPVQFPAPTATSFFPISVFKLDILSDTQQRVWTPGVDVQATIQTRPENVLTVGTTIFRDRSEDKRTTSTQMSMLGVVALVGGRVPTATVFPTPQPLGPPTIDHPARVPNASFRDAGFFAHDEWTASPLVRVTGGLRLDHYSVKTDATPGYDIESLIVGATPAVNRATLPSVSGDTISRTAVTGEAGIVIRADEPVSAFAHYVRSYRHPNLEELLFSGPATTGNVIPNVTVKPETGHNIDAGTRLRFASFVGAASYFNNTYDNFISTEVVAELPDGDSVSQAINLAKVRIQGIELEGAAPFAFGGLHWLPSANYAYTRGTVLEGQSPIEGSNLAGKPQDNITPWKLFASLKASDSSERCWVSYSVRTQGDVKRVSPLLKDSRFLIAQDLFALDGFSIQRLAAGYDWRAGQQQLGLTVAVDNVADRFYREQFQFAPARGRSVSVLLHVRGRK